MASVGKKRRERWTITAENELREAVETRRGPDSNVDWEGVARDLETTVARVKKKWYLLSKKNDSTGAVSEPHARGSHAKIPYAKLPPTNAKNADLLEYFNEHVQDPHPTSIELQGFVINGERTLEQVHSACPSAAADATATHSLIGALLLARRYKSGFAPCG